MRLKHVSYPADPLPSVGICLGVFWFTFKTYGLWWGLVYGIGWPVWFGFRLAKYLVGTS